jgi:Zn-dependent protease
MPNGQGLRLGRLAGIDIHADPSLLVILFLITLGLAAGLFPAWHPEWSLALRWLAAFAGALLFFGSILAHELAHAVVARRKGIGVSRITLFLFGGLAHMEHEPPSWRSELLMALAGPVASFALGGAFIGLGALMVPEVDLGVRGPLVALRGAGVLATILLWLGPVNLMLGLFNMVPGFPLDGGRVLRAIVWGVTGNLREATRWASLGGRAFAWLLMGSGIAMGLGLRVPFFGTGFLNGLWLILIGWFLNNAALMGYRQVVLREALESVPVSRLMRTRLVGASPHMLVSTLVDQHLMSSGQRSFPVEEDGRFVGLVCLKDLYRLPRQAWDRVTVGEVMVGLDRLAMVAPEDAATEALAVLDKREVNQLPVVDQGRFAGLVRREDVLRWLMMQSRGGRPAAA